MLAMPVLVFAQQVSNDSLGSKAIVERKDTSAPGLASVIKTDTLKKSITKVAEASDNPAVDTDLIQNLILLTDATLDLNRALLQGIQASLDSLNVKDKNVIDEKNIQLTIHRMQRQRDKAMLTPILVHMQDSLKKEISREEHEKAGFENMLRRNQLEVLTPMAKNGKDMFSKDGAVKADVNRTQDTTAGMKGTALAPDTSPGNNRLSQTDSLSRTSDSVHKRAVIEAEPLPAANIPAPIIHWETAKALYYNDDTTGDAQNSNIASGAVMNGANGGEDTIAYVPVATRGEGGGSMPPMSDSARIIKAQYYFTKAMKSSNERDFKAAAEYLKKAIDLQPRYYDARFALGEADAHLGLYTKAINEFKGCAAIDSSKANLYYKMGNVMLKMKLKDEAFTYFNKSLRMDSNYVPAIMGRALEYTDRKLYKTAGH